MFRGIDEKKFLPAVTVCVSIVLAAALLLACGCAVRHLPGGATAPATKFEQILAWNAAAAQANDGFADNVIALQKSGVLGVDAAKNILVKQGTIAKADKRITDRLKAATTCGTTQAGTNPTNDQLDAATAACAQISGPGLKDDVNLILGTVADLNDTGLLGVKDTAKQKELADTLSLVQKLLGQIYNSLEGLGVIK